MHPEMGILTGKVYQVIDNNSFKIMDLHGGDWLIFTQNEIERIDLLKQGLPLIIIGQQKENGIFEASQIRPLIRKTRQFFHQKTMPMHLNLQIERKIM